MKKSGRVLAVCLLAVGCSKNITPGGVAGGSGPSRPPAAAESGAQDAAPMQLGSPATSAATVTPVGSSDGAVATAQFLAGQTWQVCAEVRRVLRSSPAAMTALQQAENTACNAQQALRGKRPRPVFIGQVEKMALPQLREVASCPWYRGPLGDRAALRMVALVNAEKRPAVLRALRGKAACRGVPASVLASYGVAYDEQGIPAYAEKRIKQLTVGGK